MKFTASKKVLENLVRRGGIAAMIPTDGDGDEKIKDATKASVLVKAASGSVTFMSSITGAVASMHQVQAGEGLSVQEPGEVCIPVRDLAAIAGDSGDDETIGVSFTPNPGEDKLDHSTSVQSSGDTIVTNVAGGKAKVRSKIISYPASQFERPAFPESPAVAEMKAEVLRKAYNAVSFAVDQKHFAGINNKVMIADHEGGLHCAGTDGHRCAISLIPKDGLKSLSLPVALLADYAYLTPAVAVLADGEDVSILQDKDGLHMTIVGASDAGTTTVRISMVDDAIKSKFPNWKVVLGLKMASSIEIAKAELAKGLKHVARVNPARSYYVFEPKNDHVSVSARAVGESMFDVAADIRPTSTASRSRTT